MGSSLDEYRKKASFDWTKLRTILHSEEHPQQVKFYEELRKHPTILSKSPITPSQEDQKRIATKHLLDLIDIRKKLQKETEASEKDASNSFKGPSSSLRYSLSFDLFSQSVARLGTERHEKYCKKSLAGEIIGTFALTEVGHGTNTKSIQTTATYDKNTREFIIHTPNFFAAKWWMGNLGKKATHLILYAQLVMPDNKSYGLHAFIVNVRNTHTLLPYPGISITDIGEKIGLQHLDNGLIMFNKFRIPKDNLLNKTADVNDDGTYISAVVNPKRQLSVSLSMLSTARVNIAGFCIEYMKYAVTIAIRYAAEAKQNGLPIIEQQAHQVRLIPQLALTYVGQIMFSYLMSTESQFSSIDNEDHLINLGNEFHALSCAAKPLCSWLVRDGMKELKEVCGSHVYLTVLEMEDFYGVIDPSSNYEGDNYVLMQQCASFLLKLWPSIMKRKPIHFPLSSLSFLSHGMDILGSKFAITRLSDFIKPKNIVAYFQWLTCYLLKKTFEKQHLLSKENLKGFWVKNESQVYYCKILGTAYILTFYIDRFQQLALNMSDDRITMTLLKLVSLYGVWNLKKYVQYFYEGGYATNKNFVQFTEDAIVMLCKEIKNDAVALVDAIAPADCFFNSVYGFSDGNIYQRLESTITYTPGTFSKVSWRGDINEWKRNPSKL